MQWVDLIIYVDIYVNIYDKRSMCNLIKWEKTLLSAKREFIDCWSFV